jgi:hypothetical protein
MDELRSEEGLGEMLRVLYCGCGGSKWFAEVEMGARPKLVMMEQEKEGR